MFFLDRSGAGKETKRIPMNNQERQNAVQDTSVKAIPLVALKTWWFSPCKIRMTLASAAAREKSVRAIEEAG